MKVKTVQNLSNVSSWEQLRKFTSQVASDIVDVLNGSVGLVDNCQTSLVSVEFNGANIEVKVPHTLEMVPNGYLVAGKSAGFHIFNGSSSNTASDIYVQASAAGTAQLLVF